MNGEMLPNTLQEAMVFFADEARAFDFMKGIRFPTGKVTCPRCGSGDVSFLSTRRKWSCKHCTTNRQFSLRTATILEDSPLGFDKWICAFWLIANAKNGISSWEIHRALGVTQKTAWFLLHRVRLALQAGTIMTDKMGGIVEADETFIGAKARNMHADKRKKLVGKKTGPYAMTAVMGLLERHAEKGRSRVKAAVLKSVKKGDVQAEVRENVTPGAEVHTDALRSYTTLADDYNHKVVDHAETYVNGNVHTNGLENFWSLLKRTVKGTYVCPAPFHLHRYLGEQVFRFNERKDERGDLGRFLTAIGHIVGRRLTWASLTGEDRLPTTVTA